MEAEQTPHRLAILGYWLHPDGPADAARGWPDPNDLRGEWDAAERAATIEALKQGKLFREFSGTSACRICGDPLGSGERTDGVWAWPDGLEHYVEAHAVRLPDAFVARCGAPGWAQADWVAALTPERWVQGGPEAMVPLLGGGSRPWVVDDAAWLEWAAHNTPARPAADAVPLEVAREVCRRLSHSTWTADAQPIEGRWRLDLDYERARMSLYLQRCGADVLERRLLRLRPPDPDGILSQEKAVEIAAGFDGSWGSVRVLARRADAWFVWVKSADADWPSEAYLQATLQRLQLDPGWRCSHPGGGQSFVVPPLDEVAWRWLLTCEREAA